MRNYLNLLEQVLTQGKKRSNRTGIDTLSLFGAQTRYNLREGFPLVTTKKIHMKSVIHELLWFLKGSTNIEYLKNNKVRIWDEWADKNGDLGPIYPKQWTRWDSSKIIKIDPILISEFDQITYPLFKLEPVTMSSNNELLGKIYNSKFGEFKVIDYKSQDRNNYKIQFIKTGFSVWVRRDALLDLRVKDLYYPQVAGVGWPGEYKVESDLDKNLKKTWQHMLDRCYNVSCKEYKYYGQKGVTVAPRWLNFSNFREDVKLLPNWHMKKSNINDYQIDKDYYASNCYSKETCVWLTKSDNVMYNSSKAFEAVSPSGERYIGISQSRFAAEHGLERSKISAVLLKKRNHHKNWKFKYLDGNYRYELPINQIANIVNLIKKDPNSRRLVLTAWNPVDLPDMALAPCHCLAQFYVEDGELSCQLYQRSADIFLGVPFNIASYSLLTMMIAQVCDLKPGDFVHTFGDLHLYVNHIDQAKLQLSREPRDLPQMLLNPEVKNIFDFKYEDFKLVGYDPHPRIKAEVAV